MPGTRRDEFIVSKANNLAFWLGTLKPDQPLTLEFIRQEVPGFSRVEVSDADLHHILHVLSIMDYVQEQEGFDGLVYRLGKVAKKTIKSKFVKTSQMSPPMGVDPMAMGVPGVAPMGGVPGVAPMGGVPGAPMEPPVIPGPLDTIDKILVDSNAMNKLKSPDDLKTIAIEIWRMYGGYPNGDVNPKAVGQRTKLDEKRTAEEVRKANEIDEEERWRRLPKGKTIVDVVGSFDNLMDDLKKVMPSVVKEMKGGGAAGAPPMGGGMMLASSKDMMLKMASAVSALRQEGLRAHADYVEKLILKYSDKLK